MKTNQPEIKYEDYMKLISKIAWQWSKRSGWDFQELMAEGNLVFLEARNGFQSGRFYFSTYLVRCLNNHYISLIGWGRRHHIELDGEVELDSLPSRDGNPERRAALKEMIGQLSKDARMLVECTLETPRDLLWMMGLHGHAVRISRYMLQRYFVSKKGWSISHYWKVSKEIRGALATL